MSDDFANGKFDELRKMYNYLGLSLDVSDKGVFYSHEIDKPYDKQYGCCNKFKTLSLARDYLQQMFWNFVIQYQMRSGKNIDISNDALSKLTDNDLKEIFKEM